MRDMPPDQVAVPSVTELSKDAFVAGVTSTQAVREHIKMNLLHAARLEEDDAEAQVCTGPAAPRCTNRCAGAAVGWHAHILCEHQHVTLFTGYTASHDMLGDGAWVVLCHAWPRLHGRLPAW